MTKREPIPKKIQSQLLLANRHACCVCQKPRVQIHHIDEDSGNNIISNLAVACLEHHDMASMQIGLTKKLQADQVKVYKEKWEAKCKYDVLALARDRINYYCTLYKNPPRIREAFLSLAEDRRKRAVKELSRLLSEEANAKKADKGYQWQRTPTVGGDRTIASLASAFNGELWPTWLPRVGGHKDDPDYPIDLAPPYGMEAFHSFDLYCQILTQILMIANDPIPFEDICKFREEDDLNSFSGCLVDFRARVYGKGVRSPRFADQSPVSSLQIRHKNGSLLYRAKMQLKNMYVFSDTSAENLKNCNACGIGIFGGANSVASNPREIQITIIPLMIGMGGLGRSTGDGFWSE